MLHSVLVDTEKRYSGLEDACVKAGKAGCKLIELAGDNVSGDVVKTLMDDIHDVIDPPPDSSGWCVPADIAPFPS